MEIAPMHRTMMALTLAAALAAEIIPSSARAEDGPLTLMEHGRFRLAASTAEARLKTQPQDVEALRVLATVRAQQKRFDDADKFAGQAVAAAPNDADVHYTCAQIAGMHAQASSMLKMAGHAGRFKKEAEKALAINPNHQDAIELMIAFHRQAPGIMGGDKKKIGPYMDHLMQMDPTAAWLIKSDMAFDAKDSSNAEACLRQAVDAKGEARAKVSLASWLIQPWRKPDEGERLAREAVEAEPWRVGGWSILAASQAYQKRLPEMEATLTQAEAAIPGNLGPHYQAARILIVEKIDGVRAEALLRRYLTVEPEIGQPSYAGAHWRLGQALELQGKKSEAMAEMQTAVKLDPKLDGAKQDLKRLKG